MTFTGHVRNAKPGPDRIVRAGVEFFGLSEDELYVIDLLELGAFERFEGLTHSGAVGVGQDLHVVAGRVFEVEASPVVVDDALPGMPKGRPNTADPRSVTLAKMASNSSSLTRKA